MMGFTTDLMFRISIVEVIVTLLFLIPRTGFLGGILLTGYLGGATVTHLRVGDAAFMPIIIGVVVWVALGLRRPEIFSRTLARPTPRPLPHTWCPGPGDDGPGMYYVAPPEVRPSG